MSSTYSPDLRIELIGTGDQSGVWGDTTNTNLGTIIESAIAGHTTVAVAASAQAFTVVDGAPDEARFAAITLTTSTSANFAVYAPPNPKLYVLYNNTSYTATIYNSTVSGNTTAAGTGVAIPAGKVMTVWTNGTNFVQQNTHLISPTLATPTISNPTISNPTVSTGTFTSPTLVTPVLGTPSSGTLTSCTGLPISTGVSGLGTGVATALAVNVGSAGAPVVNGGALGTPSSGTLTNTTGLPISTGVSGLGTGVATFLATPSSANLKSAVTDETGSGSLVFATSPTLVTPVLGTPSSGTLTSCTGLPISTGVSGLGTGVATALAVNVGSAGAPVVYGGALGTPSSGTLTNATGLPISTGVSGLGTGVATALAVSIGSAGAPVVNGGALGTPSSGTVTNLTGTASININGTVGATTPTTGAFTTLTATNATINPETSSSNTAVTILGGASGGNSYLHFGRSAGTTTAGGLTYFNEYSGTTPNYLSLRANSISNVYVSSAGNLLVGTTTEGAGWGANFELVAHAAGSTTPYPAVLKSSFAYNYPALVCWNSATSNNNVFIEFDTDGGLGTARGSIDYNRGSGVVRYNTTSDQRLKQDIVDAPEAMPVLSKIKIRSFNWKDTGAHTDFGVIAQELFEVAPDCVSVGEDRSDGRAVYWGVDTSVLVPALVKALQELNAKLDAQAAQIKALQGL